ncbi:cytochrome c-550 PedF [Curvibacter gracilis]|uniref:cytochrome c-550 PedF n=1 Tax=Curvibacter gracilis TaxID=230310 RepID=UPI00047F6A15|nr:cytochrome c-550 PedF [Curvibacter gracilis]
MKSTSFFGRPLLWAGALLLALSGLAHAHGDVTPQAVDTGNLPKLGEEWRVDNPYSKNPEAIRIGSSGFNQNCARCHGLEAISGGIAPDLRHLDDDCAGLRDAKKQAACVRDVNDWFIGHFRHGVTRNGAVYMPGFEGILSQEAAWAIKTYLESLRVKPLAEAK